jgi:hypothetical protein
VAPHRALSTVFGQLTMTFPRFAFGALAVLFSFASVLRPDIASAQAGDDAQNTVTLGESGAPPDSPVTIPVSVATVPGAKLGAVTIRLTFPKDQLTFDKAEPSGLAVAVDAKLRSDVKAASADSSVLETRVSTIDPGGKRDPIPTGPVAYLSFRIGKAVKSGTTIPLTLVAEMETTDTPPKPIAPVKAETGPLTVADAPVPACFFYMH